MKVLLTGYSGFLGKHIARILTREGISIRVLLHKHTVHRKDFDNKIEVVWGSIEDAEVIKKAIKDIQTVVHAAWTFGTESSMRPTVNETGTHLLFKEAVASGVESFAFLSSVAVYGMNFSCNSAIEENAAKEAENETAFIYPSEKLEIENFLESFDRKNTRLGIFRPGPIFDDSKGPIKKVIRIAGRAFGLGFGNGRNDMAYIHAKDVADAIVIWLKDGKEDLIANVTPSTHIAHEEWYRNWRSAKGESINPVFLRPVLLRLMALMANFLFFILKKNRKLDINYTIACATRDLQYSNKMLKERLGWKDSETSKYTELK